MKRTFVLAALVSILATLAVSGSPPATEFIVSPGQRVLLYTSVNDAYDLPPGYLLEIVGQEVVPFFNGGRALYWQARTYVKGLGVIRGLISRAEVDAGRLVRTVSSSTDGAGVQDKLNLPPTGQVGIGEFSAVSPGGHRILVSAFSLLALTGLGLCVWHRRQKGRRRWV